MVRRFPLRHAFVSVLVVTYLAITAEALLYTLFRVRAWPWPLVRWSYGMMAPYQGDTDFNDDLLAEGKRADGTWQKIDLDPYFPVGHGEKNVRKHLRTFKPAEGVDPAGYHAAFSVFGKQLLERERLRGREYRAVRLTWQQWPRSPLGYEARKNPPDLLERVITEVPWQP